MEFMNDSLYPNSEKNLTNQVLPDNQKKPPILFRILVVIQNIENLGLIMILFFMINSLIYDITHDITLYTIFTLEAVIGGTLYVSVHFLLLFKRVPYMLLVLSLI